MKHENLFTPSQSDRSLLLITAVVVAIHAFVIIFAVIISPSSKKIREREAKRLVVQTISLSPQTSFPPVLVAEGTNNVPIPPAPPQQDEVLEFSQEMIAPEEVSTLPDPVEEVKKEPEPKIEPKSPPKPVPAPKPIEKSPVKTVEKKPIVKESPKKETKPKEVPPKKQTPPLAKEQVKPKVTVDKVAEEKKKQKIAKDKSDKAEKDKQQAIAQEENKQKVAKEKAEKEKQQALALEEQKKKAAKEKAEREKQQALLAQAQEKIANIGKNRDKLGSLQSAKSSISSGPSSISALEIDSIGNAEGPPLSDKEMSYRDEVAGRLKLLLRLPQYGEVSIKLTLQRTGKVAKVIIVSAESSENKKYVEKTLATMSFPPFGNQLGNVDEYTFSFILRNE